MAGRRRLVALLALVLVSFGQKPSFCLTVPARLAWRPSSLLLPGGGRRVAPCTESTPTPALAASPAWPSGRGGWSARGSFLLAQDEAAVSELEPQAGQVLLWPSKFGKVAVAAGCGAAWFLVLPHNLATASPLLLLSAALASSLRAPEVALPTALPATSATLAYGALAPTPRALAHMVSLAIRGLISSHVKKFVRRITIDDGALKVVVPNKLEGPPREGVFGGLVLPRTLGHMLRGYLHELVVQFDRLRFENVSISGGGVLTFRHIDLRLANLVPFRRWNRGWLRRRISADVDMMLTSEDIMQSKLIREVMQSLGNTILKHTIVPQRVLRNEALLRGMVEMNSDDDVCLVDSTMLGCIVRGFRCDSVKTMGDRVVIHGNFAKAQFSVSFRAMMRAGGRVLVVDDFDVVFQPGTANEVRLPTISTWETIDVDLGQHARIKYLYVTDEGVAVQAWASLSPVRNFKVTMEPQLPARYAFDLGSMLSVLLHPRS
mmetsp:Transcript_3994/g.11707  ORF Transcript_3994/g.11707 Transcript_3994/m.11707 type:complete len:490 (-) Transcript_3994:325-1794(-)